MGSLATTRLSSKGQVVIPEEIRERLGLKEGTQFVVVGERDVVILLPCPLPRAVPTGSWKVRTATSGSRKTPPTRLRDSGSARIPVLVRAPSVSMARKRVP